MTLFLQSSLFQIFMPEHMKKSELATSNKKELYLKTNKKSKETLLLKKLLEEERKNLEYFFDKIDLEALQKVYSILKACKGLIIFSGVGKSALVAKKIAATMTSTNTRAIYLSPMNALHGDIGIVSKEDVFVLISKSGESEELVQLLPFLRNKKATLVAVVSNLSSRLAKASDIALCLPVKKELCPFDLAPTTSSIVQMIFGDVISIALMREKNFSIDEYAFNHPAGQIGKRLTFKVGDLMLTGSEIPTAQSESKLIDCLVELSNKRCGSLLITNNDLELLGIFTDGDLRRALQQLGSKALDLPIKELMNSNPRTITRDSLASEALKLMEGSKKNEVSVLPVVDEHKKILGLLKLHDLIQTGI